MLVDTFFPRLAWKYQLLSWCRMSVPQQSFGMPSVNIAAGTFDLVYSGIDFPLSLSKSDGFVSGL